MEQRLLRVSSAVVSAQDVAIPAAAPRRNGDDWTAFEIAVMRDREADVDALFDVHDFQDVGQFADSDFAHRSLQVVCAAGFGGGADAGDCIGARGDRFYKFEG